MQPKNVFTLCLLGAAVTASTAARTGKNAGTARFDNLLASPLDATPIGFYDFLEWSGFSVGTESLPIVGQVFGVVPASPPNVAYSDVISSTFTGPVLGIAGRTQTFDLKSFYYACIDVSVTPVATAENCTITLTGYRKGTQVTSHSVSYNSDLVLSGQLDATMTLAVLSGFTNLDTVTFTYEAAITGDAPVSFIADNFKYTAHLSRGRV